MNDMIERMNTLLEQMRQDNEMRANLIREMEADLAELRRHNDERERELEDRYTLDDLGPNWW